MGQAKECVYASMSKVAHHRATKHHVSEYKLRQFFLMPDTG